MIEIIKQHTDIVEHIEVNKYEEDSNSIKFVANVFFIDKSVLTIKDYLFENGRRKYSYHWMDSKANLIFRWDNAPHWFNVKTFPFHKHDGKKKKVIESSITNLEDVLNEIESVIKKKNT